MHYNASEMHCGALRSIAAMHRRDAPRASAKMQHWEPSSKDQRNYNIYRPIINMQKPVKRGNAWRIQVKYKHLRDAATRDTSQECIQWAHKRLMELQLEYEKQLKNLDKP